MLAYLAILGATVSGYAGVKPWVIAAVAIALASISYVQHAHLYERGRELGLVSLLDSTLLRSLGNALAVASFCYAFGWVWRCAGL